MGFWEPSWLCEITEPLKSSGEVFQAKDRKLCVTFTSVLQTVKLLQVLHVGLCSGMGSRPPDRDLFPLPRHFKNILREVLSWPVQYVRHKGQRDNINLAKMILHGLFCDIDLLTVHYPILNG